MTRYIYVLVDPIEKQVRYVGQTKNCRTRIGQHVSSKTGCLAAWVAELRAVGERPRLIVVDEAKDESAAALEQEWISMLWGRCSLLNRQRYPVYDWIASPILSKWSRIKPAIIRTEAIPTANGAGIQSR